MTDDAIAAFTRLDPARIALLLDVDGTLIDLAPSPFAVDVPQSLRESLALLLDKTALALVSGRPIRDLDKFFKPLQLPAIGGHGAETRQRPGDPPERMPDLNVHFRQRVIAAVEGNPALEYEDKGYSVALHFRRARREEPRILEHVQAALAAFPGENAELLPGKMMLEVKRPGISKGAAVRALMRRDPFAGRTPVFIGDDVTDESVFAIMPDLGGLNFSVARSFPGVAHVFAAPAEVRRALAQLAGMQGR
jgi:trehalose 6-phosphate phosphatase